MSSPSTAQLQPHRACAVSSRILRTTASGFALMLAFPMLAWGEDLETLDPELREPEVLVIGSADQERLISGSASVVTAADLEESLVFTVDETLRKAGAFTRGEEGLGLRPNIGLRGLDPTRSRKVLVLEDGVPLAHSPYGDNSGYYHPPIDRFAKVEVLKGAAQIAYGPHTIGGVINYATPGATEDFTGRLTLAAGNLGYSELGVKVSDTVGPWGFVGLFDRREADGARDNMNSLSHDFFVKAILDAGEDRSLILRASHNDEDSQITYTGLTAAEFAADPRQNPFVNDEFKTHRTGASATWQQPLAGLSTETTAYWYTFERDWWRQSSNSGQRPNDASDPTCGGMANLLTTCGNEGRLRSYYVAGIEPRAQLTFETGEISHALRLGARYHIERQYRVQLNGDRPNSRTAGTSVNAGVRENETRDTAAWSAFVDNRISFGQFAITPGVRFESIESERFNRLNARGGEDSLSEVIPGLGATFDPNERLTLFAGVHRGFSPPQVSDLITSTGGSVTLDPELSWNYEAGVRARPFDGLDVEATIFKLEFENQIIPQSVAGGVGSTLTSAGETVSEGLDLNLHYDTPASSGPYARLSWVYLWNAEFVGRRNSSISGFTNVSTTGNRLPYAPEQLVSATLGYRGEGGWTTQLEWVHTSEMFTDDLNTVAVTANGQRGQIDAANTFNLAVRVPLASVLSANAAGEDDLASKLDVFVAVKNLTDELYVVDRSRGTIPGDPRRVQMGLTARF